jgi:hypothetical protein
MEAIHAEVGSSLVTRAASGDEVAFQATTTGSTT